MITQKNLQRVVDGLGPLPVSLHRLLAITARSDFDFAEISEVVEFDMVLAAAVLRRANSASSAPATRIQTVRDAVVRIGSVQTLATAMHNAVGGTLDHRMSRYTMGEGGLWRHSCASSIAATEIKAAAAVTLPASVPTTALLHDIGKVVLDLVPLDVDPPPLEDVGADLCQREREVFGTDHAAVGARVAEMWRLPPAITEGIATHHQMIDDPLPSAICLADYVAHVACPEELDADEQARIAEEAASACSILGIGHDGLARIVTSTERQLDDLVERFELQPS